MLVHLVSLKRLLIDITYGQFERYQKHNAYTLLALYPLYMIEVMFNTLTPVANHLEAPFTTMV